MLLYGHCPKMQTTESPAQVKGVRVQGDLVERAAWQGLAAWPRLKPFATNVAQNRCGCSLHRKLEALCARAAEYRFSCCAVLCLQTLDDASMSSKLAYGLFPTGTIHPSLHHRCFHQKRFHQR